MSILLLLESRPDFRKSLAAILESRGFAVDEAADLPTAEAYVEAHPPAVILLGVSAADEARLGFVARQRLRDPALPIVAMSIDDLRDAALQTGCTDFLLIPFSAAELLGALPEPEGGTPVGMPPLDVFTHP